MKPMTTEEEFQNALAMLNRCIASLKCGVKINSSAGLYADSIYYSCKEYLTTYKVNSYKH